MTSGLKAKEIQELIANALPDACIRVEDLAGDGNHYVAYVQSALFRGKTRIQQHQMIYKALGKRMGGELHALSIRTSIPEGENHE